MTTRPKVPEGYVGPIMADGTPPACRNCLFWRPPDDAAREDGLCRRRDPITGWPPISAEEWCGEYREAFRSSGTVVSPRMAV